MNTKETDLDCVNRVQELGDKCLNPNDHDDLQRVLERIKDSIENRINK